MLTIEQFASETTSILILSIIAFIFAMLLTPIYTRFAYKYAWWKQPRTHSTTGEPLKIASKLDMRRNVPLMAGMVTVFSITTVTLLLNLSREQTWLPLAGLIGGGIVGLIDDIINVRGKGGNVAGIRAPIKFALITGVALACALFFYYKLDYHTVLVPFIGDISIGWGLIPLFTLVVVSTSNAVNITDGLDGLAGGLLISAYTSFGVIATLQGNFGIAGFCMTVVGALLSYVWFNIPPARFFMGDVGSFSLGTSLGVVAMLTDTLFLLPLICAVFVTEAGSSLMQILSKKLFHRRIFVSAPVHHHFEATGWPKTKVTMRFWIIGQACAALGVVLALIGGYVN